MAYMECLGMKFIGMGQKGESALVLPMWTDRTMLPLPPCGRFVRALSKGPSCDQAPPVFLTPKHTGLEPRRTIKDMKGPSGPSLGSLIRVINPHATHVIHIVIHNPAKYQELQSDRP